MFKVRFVAALAAVLSALPLALAEDSKADASKLLGTYTIVKGQRDGKVIPAREIEGSVVVFEKGKVYGTDKDKKEFFGATYSLDTSSKPWKISMTSTSPKKGEKAEGVIKMDGDTVTICYALPGGKAPASFKAEEKQQCFVLKKGAKTDKDKKRQ